MEFRWVAGIALWTMLVGPVIGPPLQPPAPGERVTARAPLASNSEPSEMVPANSALPTR